MSSLWTYPWTLAAEGLDEAWETLNAIGVTAVDLAAHYHSVRTLQPRFPNSLLVHYPGGCYFSPDANRFDETPINPLPNEVPPFSDPLEEIVESGASHGIEVNGWVVLCHNSRLGRANPEFRLESAFGDPQDHSLCPSHPEVRAYFAAVVGAVRDRGVREIQLESLGFRSVLHGHGAEFGHDKRQVLTTRSEELLLSQCFCEGCRAAAHDHPFDMDTAQSMVQTLLRESFDTPRRDFPALGSLVVEHPVLRDLFEFRANVVETLTARLADAAGATSLNYYVMDAESLDAGELWPAGVHLEELTRHFDRVTALCYLSDPAEARQRIRGIARAVDCPIDAGVTLDPTTIRNETELRRLVDAIRGAVDGRLHIYNHALMTDTQLAWVADTI